MNQEKLTILGAGTMGHSIAISAAWAGYSPYVWGISTSNLDRAKSGVHEKLETLVKHEALTPEEMSEIQSRIQFQENLEEVLTGVTFVIEALPENLELKQGWFAKLSQQCSQDVILASSTSGLSPTQIASNVIHPERTVVTHFWNPGHLIPLVEIVRGERTSEATVNRARELLLSMQKKPILVKKDALGSVGNRLQFALFREAQYILEQGIASVEDIDTAVAYSIGRRLPITGPFLTADMGGLDTFDSISSYLFRDLSSSDSSMSLMKQLVQDGKYGQKNGSGFYEWDADFSQKMSEAREKELIEWLKKDRGNSNA